MKIRADMNVIGEDNLLAVGNVYLDELIVIHDVKVITKNPAANIRSLQRNFISFDIADPPFSAYQDSSSWRTSSDGSSGSSRMTVRM